VWFSVGLAAALLGCTQKLPPDAGPRAPAPEQQHVLTVDAAGEGATTPAAGAHPYAAGTSVRVTAVPRDGAAFAGWTGAVTGSDNPVDVVLDGDKALTAHFSPAPDTTPPTAPTGLRVTATGNTSVSLAWTAATDAVGVVAYDVDANGSLVGSTAATSFVATGLSPGTRSTFAVVARDAAGNRSGRSAAVSATTAADPAPPQRGHFQLEDLDRGVVAVKVGGGVYVGWRMLGQEYDVANPAAVSYAVYRDGAKVATVSDSTNYVDGSGTLQSRYAVSAIVGGAERARSAAAPVWAQSFLRIPLSMPPGGTTPARCSNAGEAYTYSANDASVGDLDGDGEYELVLKWDPSNSRDNSQSGCTGNVYLDAYKLSGEQLWRIDLGRNIRAGAHYTQHLVYDLDGDGKAEVAVKTAPGARDGKGASLHTGPAASDDDAADYRTENGYVLSGPEYLTVFAGPTGEELATVSFDVPRGNVSAWGDSYGNRVDRFLSSVAFVKDSGAGNPASGRPSILMARGYYTRATITAWNWRDGKLTEVWKADSDAGTAYAGQGAHSMAVADVDGDGAQEIVYGAAVINADGTRRCSTGFGHGDALHVADLVPGRAGIEVFAIHEDGAQPSWDVHDGSTCQVLQKGPVTGKDTGRGVAEAVVPGADGAQVWTGAGLFSATTGAAAGTNPASQNFVVWWDGDDTRELLDGTAVTKYGGGTLLSCSACASNNGTKATPALTADLLGDWREEVVWREADSSALRVYTTTDLTARRIYTLMHDAQYRMQVSSEQTAYDQPPHPSFFIGSAMSAPPAPSLRFTP
jgi:hypothetical protein